MKQFYDENGFGFDMIDEDAWVRDETLLNLAALFDEDEA